MFLCEWIFVSIWVNCRRPLQVSTAKMFRPVETSIYGVYSETLPKPINTGVVDVPVHTSDRRSTVKRIDRTFFILFSDVKKITCLTFQLIVGTYYMCVRQLTIVLSSRLHVFSSSSKRSNFFFIYFLNIIFI